MNRTANLTIIVLVIMIFSVVSVAKEGEEEAQKQLTLSFKRIDDNKYLTASNTYSKYLTEKLYFNVGLNLTSRFEQQQNYPVIGQGLNTSINYKPTSPISLSLNYSLSRSDAERKYQDSDVIDFKSYSFDTNLNSNTNVRFTDNINTRVSINMSKSERIEKTSDKNWDINTSRNKSIGGTINYSLTDTTSLGLVMNYSKNESEKYKDYGGGTDPVEYEDVISDASQSSLNGSLSTSKSLGENASISLSSNLALLKTVDAKNRVNDRNVLSGGAQFNLTYDIFSWLLFISEMSYSRQKSDYLYNRERKINESDYLDTITQNILYSGQFEFSIFDNTTTVISYNRSEFAPEYYIEGGTDVDPEEEIAQSIYNSYEDSFYSNVVSNLTNKLTFTLKNTIYRRKREYEITPEMNTLTRKINLNSTLTYEMSLDTTFTLEPKMDITFSGEKDEQDYSETTNYSLDFKASHTITDILMLNLQYYINEFNETDEEGDITDSSLTKRYTTNLLFTFSNTVKPSFSATMSRNSYPNRDEISYRLSPIIEVNPTEDLSIGTTLNIEYDYTDYEDESISSTKNYDLTADIDLSYKITPGVQLSMSFASITHTARVNLSYSY